MRVQCTCARCGASFSVVPAQVKRGKGKFCSKDCANAARRQHVPRVCDHCGAAYARKPSMASRGETTYCSRECYAAARADGAWITSPCKVCAEPMTYRRSTPRRFCSWACRDAGADWADPAKHQTTACGGCGEAFTARTAAGRQYCSHVCAGRASITNIAHYAPSSFETTCEQCGAPYRTTPKQTRGRFCSRRCFGLWMADGGAPTGEDSPNWRGGYDPYYGPSWRPARRAARLRDGVCQECGLTPAQNGRALDVHHLIAFRTFGRERHAEANVLSNLVTLCPVCHLRLEWATNWRQD